ncbi:uncharacterized protein MYCFIDRAFT_131279 [Pseudocercospora fijiensis CIRAD86]|uniref:Uncharacterized protein n=1 Tax=Pseudocercospora fijiensis (strain CIRAD86) TaxID=383855 RepID=M3BAQ8_PSEFD|nr:uncharacterized protein MYCFIDRAFT_131279 [Pseudocercospora fijiensis CIRAD86]EME86313.1 hypothetical protein MYCFIDRAFT_131279 [Pseudocercospora fijiensis CIRAD86]
MTPKQKEHILRLRRTDHKSEHLLLNVGRNGRRDLDLKLIGTDQYVAFIGAIEEADVKSLQERNYTGDLAEWKTVLRFALLREKPDGTLPEFLQGVETVAAISGSTSTITVRRNIGGITQRLGSIQLDQKDEEVVPMEWVDVAAATSDGLRDQLATLEASVQTQKDQIAKLSTELDMLVKAKREHEEELLSKFAALLNAKKLKIRDQQRLLNGAKVDPVAAEEISSVRAPRTSRKAGASRGGKRKANSAAPPSPEEQQHDDDDAETVDGTDDADGASRREQMTPEPSDADATTDSENEHENVDKKSAVGTTASLQSSRGRGQRAGGTTENMDLDEDLPPPRKLPFNNRKTAHESAEKPIPATMANTKDIGEDAETDDDEL